MTTTIDLKEAQHLAALIELAKSGNDVIIAEGSTPVARLTAIAAPSQHKARVAGLHQGAAWLSDDFDQPLSDLFWLGDS